MVFELLFTHPLWAYRTGTFAFASAWPRWLLGASILAGGVIVTLSLARHRALGWRLLVPVGVLQTALIALVACVLWRPVLNVERVRDRENVLAIAIDASASMAHGDRDDAQRSRLQDVAAQLQTPLAELEKTFEVRLFSFAQSTAPLESLDAIPPPGPQTRIGDALGQVLQSAGNVPLAGVVLISDGAENGGTLNEERLAEIASYGVPVHTVGVGPEQVAHDLELERVDIGSTAAAGATISAEAGIRYEGATEARLRVYDRDALIAARDVKLNPRQRCHDRRHRSACRQRRRTPVAVRARTARGRAQRGQQHAPRASSTCLQLAATFSTSKASRAGNTNSCGAPRTPIAPCASPASCARLRTNTTARV